MEDDFNHYEQYNVNTKEAKAIQYLHQQDHISFLLDNSADVNIISTTLADKLKLIKENTNRTIITVNGNTNETTIAYMKLHNLVYEISEDLLAKREKIKVINVDQKTKIANIDNYEYTFYLGRDHDNKYRSIIQPIHISIPTIEEIENTKKNYN